MSRLSFSVTTWDFFSGPATALMVASSISGSDGFLSLAGASSAASLTRFSQIRAGESSGWWRRWSSG